MIFSPSVGAAKRQPELYKRQRCVTLSIVAVNTPPSELVCVAGESVMLLVYMVALLCCLDQRFFLALLVAGPCNTFDQTRTRTNTQPPV